MVVGAVVLVVGCGGQKKSRTTTLGGNAGVVGQGSSVACATTQVSRAYVPPVQSGQGVTVNVTQSQSLSVTHAPAVATMPVIRSSAVTQGYDEPYGRPGSGITIRRAAPPVVYVQPVQPVYVQPTYVQQPVYVQPVYVESPVYVEQPSTVYYTLPGASFSAGYSAGFGGYDNTPYLRTDNSYVERGEIHHTQSLYRGGHGGSHHYPPPIQLPTTRRYDPLPGLVHHPSQYDGYHRQAPSPRGRR